MRNLVVAPETHHGKYYHLGIGKSGIRNNLSKAKEIRDYRIFKEFAFHMIEEARKKRATKIFGLDDRVYAFDTMRGIRITSSIGEHNDFGNLYNKNQIEAFFVVRAKRHRT